MANNRKPEVEKNRMQTTDEMFELVKAGKIEYVEFAWWVREREVDAWRDGARNGFER